jgi:crossover junction endonuclease MUS81
LVSKSASLTLRDVFLKMLMCVRGMSLEKAVEIQKVYPTPVEFIEAYEKCVSDDEKKDMLMKRFAGNIGRKKIGKALSAKVAAVWMGTSGDRSDEEEDEE